MLKSPTIIVHLSISFLNFFCFASYIKALLLSFGLLYHLNKLTPVNIPYVDINLSDININDINHLVNDCTVYFFYSFPSNIFGSLYLKLIFWRKLTMGPINWAKTSLWQSCLQRSLRNNNQSD